MEAPLNSRTPRVVKVTDPLEENPLPSLFEALIDRSNKQAVEEQTKKPKQTRMPDSKMAAEPRKPRMPGKPVCLLLTRSKVKRKKKKRLRIKNYPKTTMKKRKTPDQTRPHYSMTCFSVEKELIKCLRLKP